LNFKSLVAIFLVWPEEEVEDDYWSRLYPIPEKAKRKILEG